MSYAKFLSPLFVVFTTLWDILFGGPPQQLLLASTAHYTAKWNPQTSPNPYQVRMISKTGENYDIRDLTRIEYVEVERIVPQMQYVNVTVEVVRNVTQYVNVTEFIDYEGPPYTEFIDYEGPPYTEFIDYEGPPYTEYVNVTQYEFLFESVEVPVEKIVTEIKYVNVTTYIPWPFFVPVPFVQNVTQNVTQFEEVPIYMCNVTVYETLFESVLVLETDACLAHLLETFLETFMNHWKGFTILVGGIFVGMISVAAAVINHLVDNPPNRWHEFLMAFFTANTVYFGNVCVECQWQNLKDLITKLFASYASFCYFAVCLIFICFVSGIFYLIYRGRKYVISRRQKQKQQEVDEQVRQLFPKLTLNVVPSILQARADRVLFEELRGPESRSNAIRRALEDYKSATVWSEKLEKSMEQLNELMENCDRLCNEQTFDVDPDFKSFCFFFRTKVLNDYWVRAKSVNITMGVPTEQFNRFQDSCRNFQPIHQNYCARWATCPANPKRDAPAQEQDAQNAAVVESGAQQRAPAGAQI